MPALHFDSGQTESREVTHTEARPARRRVVDFHELLQ